MLLSPRKNGLTSLFKEVRVFKVIADPEKCFQELISEKLLNLLQDRPCPELISFSSNFQAFLFLERNYWNQSQSY